MKIERISDNQIKFTLSRIDLEQRNLKITELAYESHKTQELFREMMEQAFEQYDFQTENTPLMIEAIPVSADSIMIIITKVTNLDYLEDKFEMFAKNKFASHETEFEEQYDTDKSAEQSDIIIYSFATLNDVSCAALRLAEIFMGSSMLYKYESKYYLILENDSSQSTEQITETFASLFESILCEYGDKYISNVLSKQRIVEHGDSIVKSCAVQVFAYL